MNPEDSDPKYNNIISDVESIISNGIKTVLNPFINKMIDSDKQCQTITDVLKRLPEYKKLLQENTKLKQNIKQNIKLNIIEPTDSLEYHIGKLQESYTFFNNNPNILDLNINDILVSIKTLLDQYNSISNVNRIIQQSSNHEEHPYNNEDIYEKDEDSENEESEDEEQDEADEESEDKESEDEEQDEAVDNILVKEGGEEVVKESEDEEQDEAVKESENEEQDEAVDNILVKEGGEEVVKESEEKHENDNIENIEYYEVVMDIENEDGEEQETSFWTKDDDNGDFYELMQNDNIKQYIKIGTFKEGEPYFDD